MPYRQDRLCVCGHVFGVHWGKTRRQGYWNCYYEGMTKKDLLFINADEDVEGCHCRAFKLDNLAYVESKAKERKLV